ncbi:potassium-transporting ATPase subunit F [Terribacillus sp. DMT04]|nr:potassium-transporting ATPase subunit F [Terribacillus sp. DMT04]
MMVQAGLLVIGAAVILYLVYALFHPEKF